MVCQYALCRLSKQYHWYFYYYFSNAGVRGFNKCYMHMAATEAEFILRKLLFVMYFLI